MSRPWLALLAHLPLLALLQGCGDEASQPAAPVVTADAAADTAADSTLQDAAADTGPSDAPPPDHPDDTATDTTDAHADDAQDAPLPLAEAGDTAAKNWVWGVTIDDPWTQRPAILDALSSVGRPLLTRVVFDEGMAASEYHTTVQELATVTAVQGLLVDSFYVKDYTVPQYVARANEYLNLLGSTVAVWEIGNEINGEWLGDATDVTAKMVGAYQVVKQHGKPAALTLYYNGTYDGGQPTADNCWEKPENQMQQWAAANVPSEMKQGLDYVWVSYYEDDCHGIQPDWPAIFADLAAMFPNSVLGIGECGTLKDSSKAAYINRYYRDLAVALPQFAGGFFWWYGKQDFVPKTDPLWTVWRDAMGAREAAWK